MGINLTVFGSPQFSESLVPYIIENFGRVRDALVQAPNMQMGSYGITFVTQATLAGTVTFGAPFPSVPVVVAQILDPFSAKAFVEITAISATAFSFLAGSITGINFGGAMSIQWMAAT